ncbi:MAG: Ldh family oxidoreductase [Planctomycetes bacterium]|nr:Ldh family oxidoreductase [Planctomycetota bacterium]
MRFLEKDLSGYCAAVFEKVGLPPEDAQVFAGSLVGSEMRGVSSHGITRLKAYADRIRRGEINAKGKAFIAKESDSALLVDGNNGPGVVAAMDTMHFCMERAAKSGACFAAINNTSHYAAGWYFVMQASKNGMAGFAVCNADPLVVPHGGTIPMLGTNPVSIAIPAGRNPDLVLDMATSVVAMGKVELYAKLGKEIPEGWVVDKDGQPTTNPADILKCALLPFGGPKGYGISLLIDVICSSLSGAKNGRQITSIFSSDDPNGYRNIGVFMGVIDISKFVDIETFKDRVDSIYEEFKKTPPVKGVESVMLPGEIEHRNHERSRNDGIELSVPIISELRDLAKQYGILDPFAE